MNEAALWTAIGLAAAAMFGNLYWLGSKVDDLGGRLEGRIDAQTSRIDSVSARIDAQSARIDAHLDAHR
jgi:hypothetical protein